MLPKHARLPHAVFTGRAERRVRFAYGTLSLYSSAPQKAAVVVSKKVARHATARNKLKRRVAHIVRPLLTRLRGGILIHPNRAALAARAGDIRAALEQALSTR